MIIRKPTNRALGLAGGCLLLIIATAHAQTPACDFRAPSSRDASWSPDGSRLVFDSNRGGNAEIYDIKVDGSQPRRLTYTQTSNYYPFFSPDGSKIVFMAWADEIAAIYVVNADGTQLTRLTEEAGFNADPAWSPNGSQIVFYSERDGNAEIYVMNADGSDPQRLTHTESNENTPTWSPDGSKILFISDRDGNAEIYTMTADGGDPQRLTQDPVSDRVARWSPDGSQVIFYSRAPTSDTVTSAQSWAGAEIYVLPANGGSRTRLTHNNYLDQAPVWSPDGSKIAFTSCASGNREIYVMDADGSNARRLTFSNRPALDALLPLPLHQRDTATVMAYTPEGTLHTLRPGTSSVFCIADTPDDDRFSVACHPTSMRHYLERARHLRATTSRTVSDSLLALEVRNGTLALPSGAFSHFTSGTINPQTGVPDSVTVWSELALPFAEPDETGLGTENTGQAPYMMSAGRHEAHVMIDTRRIAWRELFK